EPAPIHPGLNTLLLSASSTPIPDIVALAVTTTAEGILNLPGANGAGAFAVATVNLGASGRITVSADTGGVAPAAISAVAALPLSTFICETSPMSGECLGTPATSVTTEIDGGQTPTFAVFVAGTGTVI